MLCDYRQKLGGVVNRQKIYILHSHLFAKQSHTRTYQHSISFILFSELFAPMRKGKIFSANHIFSGNAKTLYIHIQKFPEKYPGIHLEVPLNASKPSISYLKIHTRQIQVYHNWIFKSVCQIKIKWVEYFLISFFLEFTGDLCIIALRKKYLEYNLQPTQEPKKSDHPCHSEKRLYEKSMSNMNPQNHLHVVSFIGLNSGLKVHQIILAIRKRDLGGLGKVEFGNI